MDPNVTLNRVLRLIKLDTSVFDEVRDDANELIPALIVAAVSALLAGLGSFLWWQIHYEGNLDGLFLNTFILGSVFLAAMYAVWVLIAYVILVQMYKLQVDLNSLLRTMGYAALPLAAGVLGFLPVLYPVFWIVPLALLLVTSAYAVQSASGAASNQVVVANIIGFSVMVLVLGVIAMSGDNAPMGAGIFAFLYEIP
ncbi:MAG TPA: hypothetical protein VFK32_05865 [Tepidiformaceae bacterium]|nr:hypothetical protein [Tepidiformaceae bacterium]